MTTSKNEGVRSLNRDYARYEQVRKEQTYRLAEAEEQEAFDEELEVKCCDMSLLGGGTAGREQFAEQLGSALEEIGFAILVGHGIDSEIHVAAAEAVLELFTRLSTEEKLRFRAERHGSVSQGYFPIKETSEIHPDLVEGWVFCRRAFDLDDGRPTPFDASAFWPLPELEPVFRRLVQANERLILPIFESLLLYLGCDPHLYDQRLGGTNFGLRLNYYPPLDEEDLASGAGRLLGHEDVDLFTLLPAPEVEGLQLLNRENGKWVRLQAPPGSIILNSGDYLQRISNDVFRSTTHRVSPPRDRSLIGKVRISLPMAVYLWEEELLEVLPGIGEPRYEPIKAITFHTRSTSKFYGDDYAVEE